MSIATEEIPKAEEQESKEVKEKQAKPAIDYDVQALKLKELAFVALEHEFNRETSYKQQATNMQSSFSFLGAIIIMSIPPVLEYRGELTVEFFLMVYSSIFIALAISLIFATLVQKLAPNNAFNTINGIRAELEKYTEEYPDMNLDDYITDTLAPIQETKRKHNEAKSKKITISIYAFLAAIGLCIFWFIVTLIILVS